MADPQEPQVAKRLLLHDEFLDACDNVYYQPPETVKMVYPCIIYKKDKLEARHADNQQYSHLTRYQVTTIDRDPDSGWQLQIFALPYCRHVRNFVSDGLNHDVFELYY